LRSARIAAVFAPLVLLSPLAGAKAAETLSADEIRALFPGEYVAVWKDKLTVDVEAEGDGVVRGTLGFLSGSGRWSIEGDELCLSYLKKLKCGPVLKDGAWYLGLLRSDGRPRLRFRPR
jgi:hypothetical protein